MPGRAFNLSTLENGFNGKPYDHDATVDGGWQDYGMREYDTRLCRFISVDPLTSKYPFYTPYQFAGNMPIQFIDLDGCEPAMPGTDQDEVQSASVWEDGKEKEKGHYWRWNDDTQSWFDMGTDKYSTEVIDRVGSHIMKSDNIGTFLNYYTNKDFGEQWFFNAARVFERPITGTMGKLDDISEGEVKNATNLSILTHRWVDAEGWTKENNFREHVIGMFLISSLYGPTEANAIGVANETRGLIINDRQSGNLLRAWRGQPARNGGPTAFEWTDLMYNEAGLGLWSKFAKLPSAYKYSTWLRPLDPNFQKPVLAPVSTNLTTPR